MLACGSSAPAALQRRLVRTRHRQDSAHLRGHWALYAYDMGEPSFPIKHMGKSGTAN
jgi:hypothetical protein